MPIGDSITYGQGGTPGYDGYRHELEASLASALGVTVGESQAIAQPGQSTNSIKSNIDTNLAYFVPQKQPPTWILYYLGNNDISNMPTQAAWQSDTLYIWDALHAKWPSAKVLVMRVFSVPWPTQADTLDDVWIPAAIALRSSFVFTGPDARTFLNAGNTDGTHPTPAGYTAMAAAWQTAMGY